jgi:hypothetical protein
VARAHGKILTDIWVDPDFLALGPLDQWAYFMLLSQTKLSLVGSMDYEPHRWTAKAAGLTPDALDWALYALERAGFVCIDRTTRELLVRSMTRHDGLRANNPKILKGMWGQWKSPCSTVLRRRTLRSIYAGHPEWIGQSKGQSADRSARLPPSTTHHPPLGNRIRVRSQTPPLPLPRERL